MRPRLNDPADPPFVLDTNVVLDWLVFRDAAVAPALDAALARPGGRWIATTAMRDEFAEVMRRGLSSRTGVALDAALSAWHRHATLVEAASMAPRWRCRDAGDQKFVDLSLAHGARWLLTRDRDLLALARPAAAAALRIATPARWLAERFAGGRRLC